MSAAGWRWVYETDLGTFWCQLQGGAVTDRPDPLAPPEGYGQVSRGTSGQPAVNDGEVLDVCGGMCAGRHLVSEIWTIGCTAGEHAGRISYCACCARLAERTGISCLQCHLLRAGNRVPLVTSDVQLVDGVPGGGMACRQAVPDDLLTHMRGPYDDQGNAVQPGQAVQSPGEADRDRAHGDADALPGSARPV